MMMVGMRIEYHSPGIEFCSVSQSSSVVHGEHVSVLRLGAAFLRLADHLHLQLAIHGRYKAQQNYVYQLGHLESNEEGKGG